jgi:DNA-binding IscR family transcriptional regulator
VYKNFESGKGATFFKDLLKITSNKADDVDYFTALFKKENLIIESAEGGYMPATASANVLLADVVDLVHDASLVIPAYAPSDNLKKYFNTLFESMKKSRKKVMEDITLEKLIEEVG